MTYCINKDCPFKDCETHPLQLEGQHGERWFANLDSVCKRYIQYLYKEVCKENKI